MNDNIEIYGAKQNNLKNINLIIPKNKLVVMTGLSGSGKSTLIRCVNKMHEITSGELIVNDVDVKKLSGSEIRKFRRR